MVTVLKCQRCQYEWAQRGANKPLVCPKCTSPYWDRPRRFKKVE